MHSAVTNCCLKVSYVAVLRGALTLAVLSALLILGVHPAQAQTESVLYNFTGTPDGANPYSTLTFQGGNIFGTTKNGGLNGYGTVFELTPNGSGGWTESVLYNFCPAAPSCTDGANPTYTKLAFDKNGNLYGTAFNGGALGNGAVFELTPSGNTWIYNVIYSCKGQPDGANPVNGLIFDAAGNLYGTAYSGGGGGNGAVFELSPSTGGAWTEQVIVSMPTTFAGLAIDSSGNLYGTTTASVVELHPNGSGGFFTSTLFTFAAQLQGKTPNGTPFLDSAGNIYGTTVTGGKNNLGVVYKLVKGSTGKYTEKILYSFGNNGTQPYGGVVVDTAGNVYGATTAGGKNGAGIVYELVFNGTSYQERSLQAFIGENGAVSYSTLLLDSGNYLYGTTFGGGSSGQGAVFEVNPHASTTTVTCVSSLNPSVQGQSVTFTATVTSKNGPPPDGEIVVFEPVGQAAMKGGVATYTTSALNVGKTKITAVYNGDLNFITSRSVSFFQVVNP
jgi:uncharacterized repeat protein (TIGR03803 family)